jgi:hypothetical protein
MIHIGVRFHAIDVRIQEKYGFLDVIGVISLVFAMFVRLQGNVPIAKE